MTEYILWWENMRTGEIDKIVGIPEDFHDYIPQTAPVQNLYELYIKMGDDKLEAARKVLSLCLGEE